MASATPSERRLLMQAEPITTETSRRLPVQLVESSVSSKRYLGGIDNGYEAPLPIRRFAVQPIETAVKSNRSTPSMDTVSSSILNAPRFKPELASTIAKTNRKVANVPSHQESVSASSVSSRRVPTSAPLRKTSRFTPELLETTKRTRRSGDNAPALDPSDRTEHSPAQKPPLPRHSKFNRPGLLVVPPDNTPVTSTESVPKVPDSRFSSINLSKKAPRRTSFRVPHLAPIQSNPDSDGSNDSNCPSLSTSPSVASDETEMYKHASRVRESCDDGSSGYLLALAARAAERQLREQAMAAYPNENLHEPVDHFAIDRDSEASDDEADFGKLSNDPVGTNLKTVRLESSVGWDVREMRRHQDVLKGHQHRLQRAGDRGNEAGATDLAIECGAQQQSSAHATAPKNIIGGWQKGVGLSCMRNAANPPMLGHDLRFPMCISPQKTRIDATQSPYSRAKGGTASRQHSGLWVPHISKSRRSSARGLWNGVCVAQDKEHSSMLKVVQNGLLTPKVRGDHPPGPSQRGSQSPANRPSFDLSNMDDMLEFEKDIEAEFDKAFVTQIYNYLSIGYPALARKYDEELSRISRVPIDELRRNDDHTDTRGYVGAPEGTGCDEKALLDGHCARWWALRLYIREWARQQPRTVGGKALSDENWGVRGRRGSWAI